MTLRSLSFPALLTTSEHDLIQDFFGPALGQARRYDRGVGYFSSGWLRKAALGMAALGMAALRAAVSAAKPTRASRD